MQANRTKCHCGAAYGYRIQAAWAMLLAAITLLLGSGCTPDSVPENTIQETPARAARTPRPDPDSLPIVRSIPARQTPHADQTPPIDQTPLVDPTLPARELARELAAPDQEHPETQAAPAPDRKPTPQTLVVEVRGFQNQSGRCRLALYRNAKGFNQPNSAWAKQTLDVPEQGPVVWRVELEEAPESEPQSASPTRWAVSAHHDRNQNDQLDKNAFGIPTEPYGFSINPKRGFGPPKFEEACFTIGSDKPQEAFRIEIEVR